MQKLLTFVIPSLLIGSLAADTIRLRDGRELQGIVVSEESDAYVVLIQVTPTIRDQRRIAKNDVLEIVGEKKDELAFENVRKLVPAPDGLDLADYDQRIEQVEDFLKKFPESDLFPNAEPILKALHEERAVVAAGGIKFKGRMLVADERKASAFTLDSQIAAADMDNALENRQPTQALRAWDKLEREFPNSQALRDRIPVALATMRSLLSSVDRSLETLEQRTAERAAKLERVPVKDRERAKRAIEEDATRYLARVAREQEEGIRWLSLDPFQRDPMSRMKSQLESEIRRLETLNPTTMPDPDKAWADAWATLHSEPSPEDAQTAINTARTAGLPQKYLAMLEAAAPSE